MKNHIWFLLALLISLALPASIIAGVGANETELGGETRAAIETAYGTIVIRLFPDVAPKHVDNFVKLAKEGFYDGTIFHGAVPGFMIQGGDPVTKISKNTYTGCCPDKRKYGTGGPGWTVPAEFNNSPHRRGIVSMVRFKDPDSAGSQFFIVVKDSNFLDGKYTVFGEVESGMDVADKIVNLPKNNDLPYLLNERVEMKVKILELTGGGVSR
ncbi:Peptidyl-prolyl cis-trans isomerase A [Anaerolineae bacterium]|nr:Peptidyl-prolyl cis-trans isomerase A [Anaerolineae bacterium]